VACDRLISVAVEVPKHRRQGVDSNGVRPRVNGAKRVCRPWPLPPEDGSEAKGEQGMKESAVKESRQTRSPPIGWAAGGSGGEWIANRRFGLERILGRTALLGPATQQPRRASANWGWRCRRPGLWAGGIRSLLISHFSRVGGRRFENSRPRFWPAVLPGCLRGSSTPVPGRWAWVARGLSRPVTDSAAFGGASTPMAMGTSRVLKACKCCLDPDGAGPRDQVPGAVVPVPAAGAVEVRSAGGKKGGGTAALS